MTAQQAIKEDEPLTCHRCHEILDGYKINNHTVLLLGGLRVDRKFSFTCRFCNFPDTWWPYVPLKRPSKIPA